MLKTLHIISGMDPRNGGPSFALVGLTPELQKAGSPTTVVTTFREGDDPSLCKQLIKSGVDTRRIGPVKGKLGRHPQLRETLDSLIQENDIIHIHAMWEEIQHLAARLSFKHRKPYIVRPCGMLDPWSLQQSRWKKKALLTWRVRKNLQQAAALHFTTSIERDLTTQLKLKTQSIVEPNGVNTDFLLIDTPPSQTLRSKYPQISEGPIALFFSRLHPKKGTDILIKSFHKVKQKWNLQTHGPQPNLIIAGPDEGGYLAALKQLITDLDLEKSIIFTGLLTGSEKTIALRNADLFCLPSHQENFGIAVVEALAAGTPVLISDQVNIYKEIEEAGVGEATKLDTEAYSNALFKWLTDIKLRKPASESASQWALQKYSWFSIAKRWTNELYPKIHNNYRYK